MLFRWRRAIKHVIEGLARRDGRQDRHDDDEGSGDHPPTEAGPPTRPDGNGHGGEAHDRGEDDREVNEQRVGGQIEDRLHPDGP